MKKMLLLLLTVCLMLLTACSQPCDEHHFGDWIAEGNEYYRICDICKEKEFHTHTYGDWDFGQKLSGTWKLDSASSLDDSSYFSIDMKCSNGSMLYGLLDPTSESLVIVNDGTNISFALK